MLTESKTRQATAEDYAEAWPGFHPTVHEIMALIANGYSADEACRMIDADSIRERHQQGIRELEETTAYRDEDGNISYPDDITEEETDQETAKLVDSLIKELDIDGPADNGEH